MIFKGEISKYHPADALMLLSQLGLNGVFSVSAKDKMLNLSFKDGHLLDAQSGFGDDKILRSLRFKKIIDNGQHHRIRQIMAETGFPVRQILGELNLFPLTAIKEIFMAGIQEVLLELFLLDTGTFVFTDMSIDDDGAGIQLETGAVSLPVLAQADEIQDFEKTNLTLDRDVWSQAGKDISATSPLVERAVLKMAEKRQPIRHLMDTAPFGTYAVMSAVSSLLDQGRLKLGSVGIAQSTVSKTLSFDPLFSTYKQAFKKLVRADGVLKKVEAIVSFCKHHYDGILILTVKDSRFVHCKFIRMDSRKGVLQQTIKDNMGELDREPVFQAVQRSGVGFFGNVFASDIINGIVPIRDDWECALLPVVNRSDITMFFFAYTMTHYDGLSPHHYLELLFWMISQESGSGDVTTTKKIYDPEMIPSTQDNSPADKATTVDSIPAGNAIVEKIEELPPLPALASKSLNMLSDPAVSLDDVEAVIAQDQALVAKIIKVSNSVLYGGKQQVTSLRQALARLGSKTTKSLIMAASAKGYFINQRGEVQVWGRLLWQHSVECGIAARRIATAVSAIDVDQAFISGIMHDIGKVAILLLYPEKYKQIERLKNADNLTDIQAEEQLLQTDHAQIGQLLMVKWHMPEDVCRSIEFHHRPAEAGDHRQLSLIVKMADLLSHLYGDHPQSKVDESDQLLVSLADQLSITADDRETLVSAVLEDFQNTQLMAE